MACRFYCRRLTIVWARMCVYVRLCVCAHNVCILTLQRGRGPAILNTYILPHATFSALSFDLLWFSSMCACVCVCFFLLNFICKFSIRLQLRWFAAIVVLLLLFYSYFFTFWLPLYFYFQHVFDCVCMCVCVPLLYNVIAATQVHCCHRRLTATLWYICPWYAWPFVWLLCPPWRRPRQQRRRRQWTRLK